MILQVDDKNSPFETNKQLGLFFYLHHDDDYTTGILPILACQILGAVSWTELP